jgi:hypothetical protein
VVSADPEVTARFRSPDAMGGIPIDPRSVGTVVALIMMATQ